MPRWTACSTASPSIRRSDRLWIVGDLVNRGPESLRVLRFLRGLGDAASIVLGNHDLYLLMVAAGYKRRDSDDTLFQVLEADDRDELLEWLSFQPLMRAHGDHVLVHAGPAAPGWTVTRAQALAAEVGAALAGSKSREFLLHLAGNRPDRWSDGLKGWDRLRVIVNAHDPAALLHRAGAHGPERQGRAAQGAAGHAAVVPRTRPLQPHRTPSSAGTGRRSASTASRG